MATEYEDKTSGEALHRAALVIDMHSDVHVDVIRLRGGAKGACSNGATFPAGGRVG